MKGIRTEGPMAEDFDLTKARRAVDVHATQVEQELEKIKQQDPKAIAAPPALPEALIIARIETGRARDCDPRAFFAAGFERSVSLKRQPPVRSLRW
jgi:hypothetical protein